MSTKVKKTSNNKSVATFLMTIVVVLLLATSLDSGTLNAPGQPKR